LAFKEDIARLEATLEDVEGSLIQRIPQAAVRSPENLWEELETLDVVLELKMKPALR
jgi:hypothetical protein